MSKLVPVLYGKYENSPLYSYILDLLNYYYSDVMLISMIAQGHNEHKVSLSVCLSVNHPQSELACESFDHSIKPVSRLVRFVCPVVSEPVCQTVSQTGMHGYKLYRQKK